MVTVGSGDYRYELVPSWPKLPRYWSFGAVADAAVSSSDEVYVFSRGLHPLTVWDLEGNFITSWGEGRFSAMPHGVTIAPNGNVWLVDRDYHVATEHTQDGTLVRTLGNKLDPSPTFYGQPFNMPTALAIAPAGHLFVSDGYGNRRVHKFTPEGELLLSWGSPGTAPGEFALVHGVWVDAAGRVLVCDRENARIQIFNEDGEYVEEWSDFHSPNIAVVHGDVVYVTELLHGGVVSLWTLDGTLITRWSGSEGPGKGTLIRPHGLCVDSQGSIYVTEVAAGARVQKFQRI